MSAVAVAAVDDGDGPALPLGQIDSQGFLECVEKGVTFIDVVIPPAHIVEQEVLDDDDGGGRVVAVLGGDVDLALLAENHDGRVVLPIAETLIAGNGKSDGIADKASPQAWIGL